MSLQKALQTVIRAYTRPDDAIPVITDIHFCPDRETGHLVIFDDEDHVVAETTVEAWSTLSDDAFLPTVQADLERAIAAANADGAIDSLAILRPYSLVLVDEDHETIADLYLVSDDTLLLTDQLLADLDTDLDAFLDHLLSDDE